MKREEASYQEDLLQFVPDATLLIDEAGLVIQANALAERLFGYPAGTMCGQPLAALVPERFRNRHLQHLCDYFQSPRLRPMEAGLRLWGLRRDGSEFAAQISLHPLPTPNGLRVLAAVRDVSDYWRLQQALEQANAELERQVDARSAELLAANAELRQQIAERLGAETALRETEVLYRQLVESQPSLICRFLPDTTLTFVNAAYASFFDRQPEQLLGQRFIEFLCAEEQAAVRAELAAFTPAAPSRQYEHKTVRADGVARWHLWNDFAFFDEQGRIVGCQSIGLDITERKQAEARLKTTNRALQLRSACNQALVKMTDETAFLDEICRLIVEVGGYRMAWVGLAEQDRLKTVRPVGQAGYEAGYLESIRITWADEERGQGPTGRAIRTGQPVVAQELLVDPNFAPWRAEALTRGYASSIALPLRQERGVLGALNIYAADAHAFAGEELRLLAELGDDVAYGLSALRERTERRRAEKALRQASAELAAVFEALPDLHFRLARDGTILDCLSGHDSVLYVPREHLLGRRVDQVLPPDLAARLHETIEQAIGTRSLASIEYALTVPAGEKIFEARVVPMLEGQAVALVRDITNRKRTEEALRRSEERFNLAMEATQDGLWDWNVQTGEVYYSPGYSLMLGYEPGELEGSVDAWIDLLDQNDRERVLRAKFDCIDNRASGFEVEFRMRAKDGSTKWILGRGKSVARDESNRATRMLGTHVDITERKRAEAEVTRLNDELERRVEARTAELAATLHELESYSYSVSHDLRAPLRAINGYAHLLLEAEQARMGEDGKALLGRVIANTNTMATLIDGILLYARVGRQPFAPAEVELDPLVRSVAGELAEAYPRAKILVGALPKVRGDLTMLRQIFSNLVGNALKFSSARQQPVVEVGTSADNGETIAYVRDNGVGFDMIYAGKLFGMFQRLHTDPAYPGTGIGLALVKRMVERQGGRIWAQSELDRGATFYFTIAPLGIDSSRS
jgi:PAS domain S-box-containing protein